MHFNSPLSLHKADQIIDALPLSEGNRVLDVGCGTGEFLIRVVEQKRVQALGIDLQNELISVAEKAASGRVPEASCEFKAADVQSLALSEHSFDLAVCIGSTHAFGSGDAAYPNSIKKLTRLVKGGGLVLLGEGYWKQEPAAEYLELIGDPVGVYRTHGENVWFGERDGLTPLYAAVSNDDEWDHFEWSHKMKIEQESQMSPGDAGQIDRLNRSRAWRDGYLKWGRSTMGFGFYMFQTPINRQPT